VTNNGATSVSVVNRQVGTRRLTAKVATTIDLGVAPVALGLNPVTQLFYVSLANGHLGVIDAASMQAGTDDGFVTRVGVGAAPTHLVAEPRTHRVYVDNEGGNSISVIQDRGPTPRPCGEASGPGGTDLPCHCGDTATTNTVLGASDPVRSPCAGVGLFVAGGVTLDASSALLRCASSGAFTTGIWIIGDGVAIDGGIIRGCDRGIFGLTSGSAIARVTASRGGGSIVIAGQGNHLLHNRCQGNALDGMLVSGSFNTLERNYGFANEGDGIAVVGTVNTLNHNQGRSNGGHGVVATGGGNAGDGLNYGAGNTARPNCSIDGGTVTRDGRYC
jgi:hypothetical protein